MHIKTCDCCLHILQCKISLYFTVLYLYCTVSYSTFQDSVPLMNSDWRPTTDGSGRTRASVSSWLERLGLDRRRQSYNLRRYRVISSHVRFYRTRVIWSSDGICCTTTTRYVDPKDEPKQNIRHPLQSPSVLGRSRGATPVVRKVAQHTYWNIVIGRRGQSQRGAVTDKRAQYKSLVEPSVRNQG